jgi:undecaprenyl-diphosphatase
MTNVQMSKEEWLTTSLGLGRLPIAPGTWGSLPPVVLFMAAGIWFGQAAAIGTMAVLLAAGCTVSVLYSPKIIAATGSKDPRRVVSDETAGAALALLLMQALAPTDGFCLIAAVGFGLFRMFDIFKPWPCKRLEKLPEGWGILADDLAAGVWAAAIWVVGRHLDASVMALAEALGAGEGMTGRFAVFLGVVQGLTEFLPVSSSGHLVFFESFANGLDTQTPEMLMFDLCLHVGTVASILVVFWTPMVRFLRQLVHSIQDDQPWRQKMQQKPALRFLVLAVVATVTTGVFYALFKEPLEAARSLRLVAAMWLVTAAMLVAADYRHGTKGLRQFTMAMAVIIGLLQGLAILPGISRSGATICAAILLGLRTRWAIEFSFLISIPAILGGALIQFIKNFDSLMNGTLGLSYAIIGMISAFVIGILALKCLIRFSKRRKLKYFAAYCAVAAMITLVSFL